MPLQLDAPQTISDEITTLEINSFSVDLERAEIHIAYDKGNEASGSFMPVQKDLLLTIPPSEFASAIGAADVYANAMPSGSVSVYGALKLALYDKIKAITGIDGTVS